MNYESQSQDDLLAGDLAGAESPKNMNNILSGGYSKGNFGGAMKFKGPRKDDPNTDNPTKEKLASDAKTKANPEFSVDSPLPAGTSDIGGEVVGTAGKVFASFDQHLPNSNIKTGVTNTTAGKYKLHGAGTDERKSLLNSIPGSSTKKEAQKKVDDSSLKNKKDIIIRRSNPQISFKPGGANKYKK
jgi:hypothetical protein